jgi:hypothetical protein
MNQSEHTFFTNDYNDMQGVDFQTLVSSRLEDLSDQVAFLFEAGNFADAKLLRDEGLMLAESFDNESTFLYINDLTAI